MRWEPQRDGIEWAYAGEHILGMVVPVCAGSHAGEVLWDIQAVSWSKYHRATRGHCSTVAGAKRAFRRAWRAWLAERGLCEASRS